MGKLAVPQRDEKSRFRITASSAQPIADPLVSPWEVELEDEETVYFGGPLDVPKALPPDFYLRELREVELGDTNALLEMIRTFGRFGCPIQVPLILSPTKGAYDSFRTPIAEIQGHITALRWATDLWMTARDGVPMEPERTMTLIDVVNTGLMTLSPYVWAPGLTDDVAAIGSPFEPSAYTAATVQLFNDIVIQAPYRTGGNTACGRLFVRQRGRSMYAQYRLRGVKYCSYLCARASAQRNYRRRNERSS
jgi:hypothetical protein